MSRKRKKERDLEDRRNSTASVRLRTFVERIERLNEQIDEIRADVKVVKAEAKAEGFDVATIGALIKLRKISAEERAEKEAILDLYKAALGMLDGTPLGAAARRRLDEERGDEGGDGQDDPEDGTAEPPDTGDVGAGEDDAPDTDEQPAGVLTPQDLDEARQRGGADARAGVKVLANPYVADDPRRAAWDEGWCQEKGSDGMDLPEAWRRTKKKKPDDEGGGDE